MAFSHFGGIAWTAISAINAIAKAAIAAINGVAPAAGGGGGTDPTLRQSKVLTASSGATASGALDSAVLAGSLLVAFVSLYCPSGAPTVTVSSTIGGSAANTWTTHETDSVNVTGCAIAAAPNASAGTTTVSIGVTGAGAFYTDAVICEFTVIATTTPFDVSQSLNGTSTTASTGTTAAKTQDKQLVVGMFGMTATAKLSQPTGQGTTAIYTDATDTFQAIAAFYKVVNAPGAEGPITVSWSGAEEWVGAIATFKAAP